MNFLAPLFLLGALAIAGPVIFHLIRQTTRERTLFSSLMFLLPTPPRLTRRSRLEELLLLAFRCAVICLLAFAFARPFFKRAEASLWSPRGRTRTLLLLDVSASMRRSGLWQQALDSALSVVGRHGSGDDLAIYSFDRQITPVMTFEQWRQISPGERTGIARQMLKSLSPGWAATQTGHAIVNAAELLTEADGQDVATRSTLTLISDLQDGSHLDAMQGYEWPKNVSLELLSVKPKRVSNASLQLVTEAPASEEKAKPGVRVRIANAPDSRREQFKVGWAQTNGPGFLAPPLEVYVPAGQSRTATLSSPPTPGTPASLLLEGDDEDFDNRVAVVAPDPSRLSVLYVGNNSESDPKQQLYFLKRALQDTRYQRIALQSIRPGETLEPAALNSATLIVLTDAISPESAEKLRQAVSSGKTLLFPLSSQTLGPTLGALLGKEPVALKEVQPKTYAMLAEIDYRHPFFAPFADPRFSDFTKIRFWKYRALDKSQLPSARVLAKFDSGDPAILEIPEGKGRFLIIAAGWHQDDGQLALSTKFVPMIYTLLEESGAPAPPPFQYFVGDSLPISTLNCTPESAKSRLVGKPSTPCLVTSPDGTSTQLKPGETNFSRTLLPGVYQVSTGASQARFAVNVDPSESRLAMVAPEELERLGAPLSLTQGKAAARETARMSRIRNAELENRQKVWRWAILGALVVLLTETWLAGRKTRPATAEKGVA